MYVSTSKTTKNGKTYTTHMLRHSYRENGKVKHRNVGCLNLCSEDEVAAIRFALANKKEVQNMINIRDIKIKQGKSFGSVWATYQIAKLLSIDLSLGDSNDGKIALLQVLARTIAQGSKLKAVRMQDTHALCEVIGIEPRINDDKIYRNLDWLASKQEEIEKKLWKYNDKNKQDKHLFLYDVTSTYLEGEENEYAAYGYNRDGKKGKKQLVIGLLTNDEGKPIKISVYDGNTGDTKTFADQVKASAKQFGVKEVTFVGDRGMIKSPQIKDLPEGCTYITALSRKEINSLIKGGLIQLGLFDQELKEVANKKTGERYILRCNPIRKKELTDSRRSKIRKILDLTKERNQFVKASKTAKAETSYKQIKAKIAQYNLAGIINIQAFQKENKEIKLSINRIGYKKARELDGCYIIKSNVSTEISKEKIHARYKDLKYVEDGFRTMKQSHLELRPVYVRKKERTEAHVFIVFLSYMIAREMRLLLAQNSEEILTKEVIDSLGSIVLHHVGCPTKKTAIEENKNSLYNVPEASDLNKQYLNALNITLPEVFINGMNVAKPKSKKL